MSEAPCSSPVWDSGQLPLHAGSVQTTTVAAILSFLAVLCFFVPVGRVLLPRKVRSLKMCVGGWVETQCRGHSSTESVRRIGSLTAFREVRGS